MKNTFMAGAAVVALLIGTGMASAQTDQRRPPEIKDSGSTQMRSDESARDRKAKPRAETSGQAGSKTELQNKSEKSLSAQPKSSTQTSGQATTSQQTQKGGDKSSTQMKAGTSVKTSGQASDAGAETKSGASSALSSSSATSVNLTTEQKTKIRQTVIARKDAPRVAHVDFSLNVGTPVPRTIRLATLPATIVEIRPAWRGYLYFLIGDEIVVVNPRNMEIVAILVV